MYTKVAVYDLFINLFVNRSTCISIKDGILTTNNYNPGSGCLHADYTAGNGNNISAFNILLKTEFWY